MYLENNLLYAISHEKKKNLHLNLWEAVTIDYTNEISIYLCALT